MRSPITQNGLSEPIVIGLGLRAENRVHGYAGTALRRRSIRSLASFTAEEASAE